MTTDIDMDLVMDRLQRVTGTATIAGSVIAEPRPGMKTC